MNEQEIENRLTALETNEKNIFRQLTEIKSENKAIQKLAKSVYVIAEKTQQTADAVEKIDFRLNTLERVPAENAKDWQKALISTVISVVVGGLLGYFLSLILKQ